MSPTAAPAIEPRAIQVRTVYLVSGERHVLLDSEAWPQVALIADVVVRDGLDPVVLRYPYLTISFDNAHAVYEVDTCDRGLWTGRLVEGWVGRAA